MADEQEEEALYPMEGDNGKGQAQLVEDVVEGADEEAGLKKGSEAEAASSQSAEPGEGAGFLPADRGHRRWRGDPRG